MRKFLVSINVVVQLPDKVNPESIFCTNEQKEFHFSDGYTQFPNAVLEYATELVEELYD